MDKKSTFLVVYFAGKLSEDRARHIFDIVSHTLVVAHEEQFPYLLQPFSSPATYGIGYVTFNLTSLIT